MPAQPTEWTVEMVRALPDDGNRYEIIDGELYVTPAPSWTHQRAASEMLLLLAPYLRRHDIGDSLIAQPTSCSARGTSWRPTSSSCRW